MVTKLVVSAIVYA